MRASLYIIFFLTLSNSLLAQEKRVWNNQGDIYERLDYHRENFNEDSALYYVDELLQFLVEKQKDKTLGKVAINTTKIAVLIEFKRYDEALELALHSIDSCGEGIKPKLCHPCGSTYQYLVDLMIILQDYRQGIRYLDMTCEEQKEALYFYKRAKLFSLLEKPDSALAMTEKWVSNVKKSGDEKNLIAAYNQHGIIAKDLKRFDIAIPAFSEAIDIAKNNNLNISNYAFIMGNLGDSYRSVKEYDKAYEFLLIDSEESVKQKYKGSYVSAELSLAEIDLARKDYSILINRLNNLSGNYDKSLLPKQRLTIVEMLMNAHKALGNESAYTVYSNLWITLNKEFYLNQGETQKKMGDRQAANSLKQVTQKMKLQKQLKEQEFLTLKNEGEKRRFKLLLLIMGLLMGMGIVLFVFWRYKATQTKLTIIKQAKLDLAKHEQEILKLKVKEEGRNVQLLSHELQVKQDFSLNLMQQLGQLGNLSTPELKRIEIFIQNELDVKSSRAQIQKGMGELSGDFYNSLSVQYPNLTDMDLKLAAMVVMNMSNKEIAISKNIATASVKKTKTRLKQKLNLQHEDDLASFLKAML